MTTLWLDVEDLFDYARVWSRPSGIQRLSFELYTAMRGLAAERIGFVRRDRLAGTTTVVDWSEVDEMYWRMVNAPAKPKAGEPVEDEEAPPAPFLLDAPARGPIRRLGQYLPLELRAPLGNALYAQRDSMRHFARFFRNLPGVLLGRRKPARVVVAEAVTDGGAPALQASLDHIPAETDLTFGDVAKPGDYFLALGAPWSDPNYAAYIESLTKAYGLRFGMMVYDLIPIVRPEFCDGILTAALERFLKTSLPLADIVLAISQATADDIVRWAERENLPLRQPPHVMPIGTGFRPVVEKAEIPEGLTAGEYVLFVSTIEARKNHVLAFRAWRRLIETMPPGSVPKLVFAGRVGWMISDLMMSLKNSNYLDGYVVIVEEATDAVLAALYQGARFTLFPSQYEGWGLPVSESLAFGKVCIGSNSTSVPEAGGPFCLYHDPDSVTEAVALYRRALSEPDLISGLEAKIRQDYRPTTWIDSATSLLNRLT